MTPLSPVTDKLEPCPRCGNGAFVGLNNEIWCRTDMCLRLPPRASEAEAIEAWNTRHLAMQSANPTGSDELDTVMLGRFVAQYEEGAQGFFVDADEAQEVALQVKAALSLGKLIIDEIDADPDVPTDVCIKVFAAVKRAFRDAPANAIAAPDTDLQAKFSAFVSHATGGRTSDISLPLNTLSVMASRKVNDAWEAALAKGRAEWSPDTDRTGSDEIVSRDWLVRQLEAWPTRIDPDKTINIEYLMKRAAAAIAAPDTDRVAVLERALLEKIRSDAYCDEAVCAEPDSPNCHCRAEFQHAIDRAALSAMSRDDAGVVTRLVVALESCRAWFEVREEAGIQHPAMLKIIDEALSSVGGEGLHD